MVNERQTYTNFKGWYFSNFYYFRFTSEPLNLILGEVKRPFCLCRSLQFTGRTSVCRSTSRSSVLRLDRRGPGNTPEYGPRSPSLSKDTGGRDYKGSRKSRVPTDPRAILLPPTTVLTSTFRSRGPLGPPGPVPGLHCPAPPPPRADERPSDCGPRSDGSLGLEPVLYPNKTGVRRGLERSGRGMTTF